MVWCWLARLGRKAPAQKMLAGQSAQARTIATEASRSRCDFPCPVDETKSAWDTFVAKHQISLTDQESADWHAEMLHLKGWNNTVSVQPIPAPVDNVAPPGPIESKKRAKVAPRSKTLSPPAEDVTAEAQAFLDWIRGHCLTGEYGNSDLSALYVRYLSAERIEPASENFLREAMLSLPGCRKEIRKERLPDGRRWKPTIWIIDPVLAQPAANVAA